MRQSIRLGNIAGIPVGANWSVLVIAALLTVTLSGSLLPAIVPGLESGAYVAAAVLGAIVFLASLVAHEFGHALTARRYGVETESITLWALGGVAQLRSDAPSARAEGLIAAAGPAVSLGLGLFFGGLTVGAAVANAAPLLIAVLGWLAIVNVILGVFNLLPGFPLDGGRVLRALIWWRKGPTGRLAATRTAAKVGRVVGVGLIALGLFEYVRGGFGGLWTALIGWFLISASRREETGVAVHDALAGRTAGALMARLEPEPAPSWVGLDWLAGHRGAQPRVVIGMTYTPVGLIDCTVLDAVAPERYPHVTVGQVMWPLDRTVAVESHRPADDLLELITPERPVAVVWEQGRMIGVVRRGDLLEPLSPQPEAAR